MDCILMENCRLCQSKPGIFPFILDEEFIQKTMECTKITLDDDLNSLLPNFICDDCKMKILEFSEYINEVKRIDENLRRIASSYTQMDSPSKNDAEMESEHKCNKCPATFSDTETYDIHLKSHSTVSKFECTVCSKTFNRECNFELHMKNHLELYCSMCDSTFTNGAEKEVHICAVHVKKEEIEDDSDIVEEAPKAYENVLPTTSKERYEHAYNQFMDWRQKSKVKGFTETVLLSYFCDLKAKYKSSTLWSIYSMLRGTLVAKHDVNIASYFKLKALLKKESVNYVAKKANVLTNDHINTFIDTAPNELYLLTKTALIFGVCGCMRKGELYNVKVGDITDVNSALIVDVPYTRSKKPRKFVITDNFYSVCKQYINLRPLGMTDKNQKFFINYQKGKCTKQVVGINKFGKLVQDIAKFLKLPHPETYTGHTYRRTSATIVAEQTGDHMALKRHGGWQSSGTSEGYVHIVQAAATTSDTKPPPLFVTSLVVIPEDH